MYSRLRDTKTLKHVIVTKTRLVGLEWNKETHYKRCCFEDKQAKLRSLMIKVIRDH